MPDMSLIARGLTYRVGDATLVSDVDFAAFPGEVLAVIGPNGAGKSTLLHLLSGNLKASAGVITIDGIDTSTTAPSDLALIRGVLTQRARSDIPFSVIQVVAMGRFPHRRDPANSSAIDTTIVAEAMERTDTTRFARRIYSTLSGGEQTRVSLARVLAQDTPIVFLDEPTTALDVANQERIMKETLSIASQGRTVIAVLHDLNAAAVYADRIVLMDGGRIVATGPPAEVLTSELLSEVYHQALVVVDHPFRACPLVLPAD